MTSERERVRWREATALLDAALDLPPDERAGFIDAACPNDAALRAEVTSWLRACADSASFLDEPIGTTAASLVRDALSESDTSLIGTRVGPYRIVREAGRGGMGVVFVAERADGEYRKEVALKLVSRRPGMEAFSVQRFREERQILASLEHHGIARLLDGGVTADGTPWFAMELVHGVPVDEYCAEHELDVAARLELFARICDTVQYAHARGVVHRDLKPANILVVRDGSVKLLDFGIATLGDQHAGGPESRLMTREYASPEQRAGAAVTPASDVYSLGVLLIRLLGPRGPRGLARVLRKAREESPERRYPDAGELAAAVRAYGASRSPLVPFASRRAVTAGAVMLVAIGVFAFTMRERAGRRDAITPTLVLFPFEPLTPDSALEAVGRGISASLAFDIARLGEVRTVSERAPVTPTSRRRGAPRYADDDVLTRARRAGAHAIVRGTLERAGDKLRADATVYLARRRTPVAFVSVTTVPDVQVLSDSLRTRLLAQLVTVHDDGAGGTTIVTLRPAAALEAYFEGEALATRNRMPEAAAAFARAIAADSSFWPAYWRLAWTAAFGARAVDSSITATYRAHLDALSEPDRLLARAALSPSLVERIALTRAATRRFPEYWPAWLDHGDVLLHYGPYAGYPISAARAPLERAVQLEPRLLSARDHLLLEAFSEGDTARSGALLVSLRRMGYDSSGSYARGIAMLGYYGFIDRVLRSPDGTSAPRETEAFARLIAGPDRTSDGRFQGGFLRYGCLGARIAVARRVLALPDVQPSRRAFELNEMASAWAARGAFDSALVASDSARRVDTTALRAIASYRLAVVATWLGGVAPNVAAVRRPPAAREVGMTPTERVELAWLDGILAIVQRDTLGVGRARRTLRLQATDDSGAMLADSSLLAFSLDLRGDRPQAIRTFSALERDRMDERLRGHPYRGGIDRLALGRLLRSAGRPADARSVLTWHEALIARDVGTGTANAVLAGPAYLERARSELASRDTLAARRHLREFLRRYDMADAHAAWVREARDVLTH